MTIKTKTEAVKYHYSEAKDSAKRHVFTPKFIASQEDRRGKLTVAVFKDLNGVKRGSKYLSENAKKSNLYNRLGAVHGLPDSLDSILTEANMKDGAATNAVLLEDITRSLEKNGADLAAEIHKDPRAAMSMMVGTYKRILDDLDKSYGELKPFFSAVRTANSLISKQAAIRFHRGPKSLFVEADERKLVQLATYINNHQDQFKEQLKTLKAAQVHLDMITE
ncbi:MAG: hypothetical protein KGH74_04060, partial [Candidatus Micrarchaeota archaeon]|nr:hypothetical protein [Candidatus Micrarchaeota archaeon]